MLRRSIRLAVSATTPPSDRRVEIRRKQPMWNYIRLSAGRRRLDRNAIMGNSPKFSIFTVLK